jgi:MYXO-CTERM domain-containing protein
VTVGGQTFGFDSSGQVVAIPGPKPKTGSGSSGGFGCAGCSNTAAPKQGAGEGAAYALVVLGFLGYRRWLGRRR